MSSNGHGTTNGETSQAEEPKIRGFKYRQAEIGGQLPCSERRDHCKLYYAQLEGQDRPGLGKAELGTLTT